MIVVATLLCDRKKSSQLVGIPAASQLEGDIRLYVNIECPHGGDQFKEEYAPLMNFIQSESPVMVDTDVWRWDSTWRQSPQHDQDQRRLHPIVIARNMARAYMLDQGASHILFVDADVIVRPDGLQKLLSLDRPLCGGFVPGRGAHSHVWYVFGDPKPVEGHPNVIECVHGTCGYMLVRRDLMSTLAFRAGLSREDMQTPLSEDPAFCSDAFVNGFGRFWIHRDAIAQHWDDPKNPFTGNQASDDYDIPV